MLVNTDLDYVLMIQTFLLFMNAEPAVQMPRILQKADIAGTVCLSENQKKFEIAKNGVLTSLT